MNQIEREMVEILQDPETPERCRRLAEEHFNLDVGVNNYLRNSNNALINLIY
mgnify:CR=1 FL=1